LVIDILNWCLVIDILNWCLVIDILNWCLVIDILNWCLVSYLCFPWCLQLFVRVMNLIGFTSIYIYLQIAKEFRE